MEEELSIQNFILFHIPKERSSILGHPVLYIFEIVISYLLDIIYKGVLIKGATCESLCITYIVTFSISVDLEDNRG